MRRANLTDAEKERIANLRERGFTYSKIAELVKCSHGSVQWCCLQLGADKPGKRPKAGNRPQVYQRVTGVVRAFTPEEDALLVKLHLQGFGDLEIGRRLNRRHNSIHGRLMTLARRDERQEAA